MTLRLATVDPTNYAHGGFYDKDFTLSDLSVLDQYVDRIDELFPAYEYTRTMPKRIASDSDRFCTYMQNLVADQMAVTYSVPACSLVKIEDAALWHDHLFIKTASGYTHAYELMRPADREGIWTPDTARLEIAIRDNKGIELPGSFLFIGSAGSRNYGHFLVDDLPRLKAFGTLNDTTPLMTAYSDAINTVKSEATHLLGVRDIRFVPPENPILLKNVYYATPVNYHPKAKNAHALQWVRDSFVSEGNTKGKVFIDRPASDPRTISNRSEALAVITDHGYDLIEPGSLSFKDQISIFSQATGVVGLMGAAMTNTVFSPAGASVAYLAPTNWGEQFYWDLACCCGQAYSAYYGEMARIGKHAHQSPFSISTDGLESFLQSAS